MPEVNRDIIRNLKDFYSEVAKICGYDSGRFKGLDYVWNKSGNWPGYMIGKPNQEQAGIVSDEISRHGLPPFWIMDDEKDAELIALLDKKGIRAIRRWSGMVLNPEDYKPAAETGKLKININNAGDLSDWLSLVNTELMSGTQIGSEVGDAFTQSNNFRWLTGYVGDAHAASGLLYTSENIAGIYMIVTKHELRGKGFGSYLTSHLIDYAIEMGVERIVLHATPLGEGVYSKLGFKAVNEISIFWKLGY